MRRTIVAEISKNWRDGQPVSGDPTPVAQLFENIIAVNEARGYRLHSWRLSREMVNFDELNETIIAVFEYLDIENLT